MIRLLSRCRKTCRTGPIARVIFVCLPGLPARQPDRRQLEYRVSMAVESDSNNDSQSEDDGDKENAPPPIDPDLDESDEAAEH